MEFAIYYFKDKSVEVGKTSWMSIEDQQRCPKLITQCPNLEDDGWMKVKWDTGRKKSDGPAFFPAKVLMFGGKLLNFIAFFAIHHFIFPWSIVSNHDRSRF